MEQSKHCNCKCHEWYFFWRTCCGRAEAEFENSRSHTATECLPPQGEACGKQEGTDAQFAARSARQSRPIQNKNEGNDFKVIIDLKPFHHFRNTITGREIKHYVNAPANYGVWKKRYGMKEDAEIGNDEEFQITGGESFFTGTKDIWEG